MAKHLRTNQTGFTLVELIIVIVVLGVLSAYAVMRGGSAGKYTVLSQAETMASNLRHAQTLATTIGKRLSVTVDQGANGTYSVSCVTASTSLPCNAATGVSMTDPVTGAPFFVQLEKDVSLTTASGVLYLDSLGRPVNGLGVPLSDAVVYVLGADGTVVKNVIVAPLTGFVSVQ